MVTSNTSNPKITLEQWRTLLAVVDAGGYAQAAELLDKSQSSVSYAVQRMEKTLGLNIFRIEGRRAVLTNAGQVLYRRARFLVDEASELEGAACEYAAGTEARIGLAVEQLVPADIVLYGLSRFAETFPHTQIELYESVLSGTEDALLSRQVDLAICTTVPVGFLGSVIMRSHFIAVAHPDHPLHQLGREVTYRDLHQHRQIILRDSGVHRRRNAGWQETDQRWTVSHMTTKISALKAGLGFSWMPKEMIERELNENLLKPLRLREGAERQTEIFLVFADRDLAGPATRALGEIFRSEAKECVRRLRK